MGKLGLLTTAVWVQAVVCAACMASPPVRSAVLPRQTTRADSTAPVFAQQLSDEDSNRFCPVLPLPEILDLNVYPVPDLSEPRPHVAFYDPVFGSCIARVSDDETDFAQEDQSEGMYPEASGVQAFNADSSLFLVHSSAWFWYVYSAESLEMVTTLPFSGDLDLRWDAVAPDLLYGLEGTRLFAFDMTVGVQETVHDFAADFSANTLQSISMGHLGNPSLDGRYWPLAAFDFQGQTTALLIYDMFAGQTAARMELPDGTVVEGVELSPISGFLLAWFQKSCETENLASSTPTCGVALYDQSLTHGRVLLTNASSADTALDGAGQEVLVYHNQAFNSISIMNLFTGEETNLWLLDRAGASLGLNISGQAADVPGWVLVSTYGAAPNRADMNRAGEKPATWMDNTIFALELKADGRALRLAHTHSIDLTDALLKPEAGPQATPNADFTRIIFTSNWGRADQGVKDIYMIALPAGWPEMLP